MLGDRSRRDHPVDVGEGLLGLGQEVPATHIFKQEFSQDQVYRFPAEGLERFSSVVRLGDAVLFGVDQFR